MHAGDLSFNAFGLATQLGAIVSESFRLNLIQILLQVRVSHVHACMGWWVQHCTDTVY